MADLVSSFLDLLLFKVKADLASPVCMVFFSEDSFSMWSGASTFMASMLGVLSQLIFYPVLKGSDGLFVTARGYGGCVTTALRMFVCSAFRV